MERFWNDRSEIVCIVIVAAGITSTSDQKHSNIFLQMGWTVAAN
jgi:hypothetical protein